MARATMPVLGSILAVLATSTVLCLQIIAAVNIGTWPLQPVTTSAACLQLIVLMILWWLAATRVLQTGHVLSVTQLNLAFGLELLACALAAAVSAAALAHLAIVRDHSGAPAVQARTRLLAGTSVAVALATVLQLAFIILHFMSSRELALRDTLLPEAHADSQRSSRLCRVQSIPHGQTRSGGDGATGEMAFIDRPPPVVTAATMTEKDCLSRAPYSQVVRPSSSETKLIAAAAQRRPLSADSDRRGSSVEESSFDSWDTSSVDMHNRQVVLDMSSSPSTKPPGLETIPASPSNSRSPSPGNPLDPAPLRSVRSSRSLSHSTLRRREDARLTPASSINELHIHPLFRSDSQDPPPLASPGTSVLASPNAGQVISRCQSMNSLRRMRSGSLPAVHSPLIHQASLEGAELRMQARSQPADDAEPQARSQGEPERMMTPPVPAWLLSRGPQPSLDGA